MEAIKDCDYIVKKGKDQIACHDRVFADNIRLACGLMADIRKIDPMLKAQKEVIAERAREYIDNAGTVTFIVDEISCKVTFGYECTIPEGNIEEVRRLLGDRFEDLVKVKTVYNGTSKLIEMAADADRGRAIAKHLVVKEKSPSIQITEETA